MYSVITGHVDGDESIIDAAIREAKEEANLSLTEQDLTFGCVMHSKATDLNVEIIDFFFVANSWPDTLQNAEPNKCQELKFVPINDLPENMVPHVAHGINCVMRKIPLYINSW